MEAVDLPNGYCMNIVNKGYGIKHNDKIYFANGTILHINDCLSNYIAVPIINIKQETYDNIVYFIDKEQYLPKIDLKRIVKDYPLLQDACEKYYPGDLGFVPASEIPDKTMVTIATQDVFYVKYQNCLYGLGHTTQIKDMKTMVKMCQ